MAETIKIDNSDKIDNYLELAEEAREIGDFNKVEVYCVVAGVKLPKNAGEKFPLLGI